MNMFEDIKKLLKTLKRGIVVVENGRPSFVIVPFEEYRQGVSSGEARVQDELSRGGERTQAIDDVSLIQRMISASVESEAAARTDEETAEANAEIKEVLDSLDRERETGAAPRRADEAPRTIRLEDLPF